MPYLHCPRCHRTAWVRERAAAAIACRHCGAMLDALSDSDARLLTRAVRERLAYDARRTGGPPRFIRDPQRLPD